MNQSRTFRLLVAASAFLYLGWIVLPHLPRAFIPEVRPLLEKSGYGGADWVTAPWFYLGLGGAKMLASLGLFMFLAWGRWLFLAATVVAIASIFFAGISVASPLDGLVGFVATLVDGAILGLAFFSPIAAQMRPHGRLG